MRRDARAHLVERLVRARARAYLQVQQGCDHRCTFCIIPYARGPSRSVPLAAIIEEARGLVAHGAGEIVLTGVDLTAYGADLPGRPTLGQMVRRLLAAVPELPRLRLSSLDPSEIDEALWALLADEERLMPHLHLSLQAGDDLILKRMKRRHSRAQARRAAARRARALRPEIALGADLIAGFPTETEAMFRDTSISSRNAASPSSTSFPTARAPARRRRACRQLDPAPSCASAPPGCARPARGARRRARRRVGEMRMVLVERGRGRAEHYAPVRIQASDGALVDRRLALDRRQRVSTPEPARLGAACGRKGWRRWAAPRTGRRPLPTSPPLAAGRRRCLE